MQSACPTFFSVWILSCGYIKTFHLFLYGISLSYQTNTMLQWYMNEL
jgi:hypothetical protein